MDRATQSARRADGGLYDPSSAPRLRRGRFDHAHAGRKVNILRFDPRSNDRGTPLCALRCGPEAPAIRAQGADVRDLRAGLRNRCGGEVINACRDH